MSKYKKFSSFLSAKFRNYSSHPGNKLLCSNRNFANTTQHDRKEDKETHFGFETVKESEKSSKVHKVFEDVAAKYDVMNDAMSLGIHRLWKDIFMCRLAPTPGTKLLDVAGGTGDIAFRFLHYLSSLEGPRRSSHVTVCDINAHMLEVGKGRASSLGLDPASLAWLEGDAERLQLESETFDAYTVAFGMRNVTRVEEALREAWRVLRPGGRFMCLEFSRVHNPTIQRLYDQYSFQVIPVLGQILAGQWKPYQYLVESIRQFPDQETFKSMIEEAGFKQVSYENLTFGIVAIHSGFKL